MKGASLLGGGGGGGGGGGFGITPLSIHLAWKRESSFQKKVTFITPFLLGGGGVVGWGGAASQEHYK